MLWAGAMGSLTTTATTGPTAQAAPLSTRNEALRVRRRVRILFRQVAIWLDNWGLRGYPHDTHDWASKAEWLRSLKHTTRCVRHRKLVQEVNRRAS